MPETFYIYKDGRQHGPFTLEDLKRFTAEKRLIREDKVRRAESDQWMAAGRYEALFPPPKKRPMSLPDTPTTERKTAPAGRWLIVSLLAANVAVFVGLLAWIVIKLTR